MLVVGGNIGRCCGCSLAAGGGVIRRRRGSSTDAGCGGGGRCAMMMGSVGADEGNCVSQRV